MRQRKRDTPKNGTGFVLCLTEMIDEENGDNSNVRQLKRSLAVVTCATRWEEETKRERSVPHLVCGLWPYPSCGCSSRS